MKSILITGASRGIGLELVHQLLQDPNNKIIACARNPQESALVKITSANLTLVTLEVTSEESIKAAVKVVDGLFPAGLDVLVNNAGIFLSKDENDVPWTMMQS